MTDEVHHFGSGESEGESEELTPEEQEYNRQFHVELVVVPWRGSWRTEPENASILHTRTVYINGHVMKFGRDPYPEDPELGKTYEIDQGKATIEAGPFMLIHLRRLTRESFDVLEVTADDWMEGTTEETLILPVCSLIVRTDLDLSGDPSKDPCSY